MFSYDVNIKLFFPGDYQLTSNEKKSDEKM